VPAIYSADLKILRITAGQIRSAT